MYEIVLHLEMYTDRLGQVYTYIYTLKHTHILHLHINIYMYTHIEPTDD